MHREFPDHAVLLGSPLPCSPLAAVMSSKISWDEKNLDENEQESLQANRMKIDEPKTPFHRLQEDGEEPESFPPKARAARPAGVGVHDNVPGASAALDLNQITSEALARRGEEPRMGEDGTAQPALSPLSPGTRGPSCARVRTRCESIIAHPSYRTHLQLTARRVRLAPQSSTRTSRRTARSITKCPQEAWQRCEHRQQQRWRRTRTRTKSSLPPPSA